MLETPTGTVPVAGSGINRKRKVLLSILVVALTVGVVLFIGGLTYFLNTHTFKVEGDAMLPTLKNGSRVQVSTLFFSPQALHRGDIIVFEAPIEPRDYIKRVIAVEGETVEIKADSDPLGDPSVPHECYGCGVFVNGIKLDEPYIFQNADYNYGPREVAAGHVFVLGDNRRNSSDSHVWGDLETGKIKGKVISRGWGLPFLSNNIYPGTEPKR